MAALLGCPRSGRADKDAASLYLPLLLLGHQLLPAFLVGAWYPGSTVGEAARIHSPLAGPQGQDSEHVE